MIQLNGKQIYLSTLEKEHCHALWSSFEYDFSQKTEPLNIGYSISLADDWFEQIKKEQGKSHIRLGIFLTDGTIIGDIALQDIEWLNRTCTIGIGISKLSDRHQGYATEALQLILQYAFNHLGLEKISATTLQPNIACQMLLQKVGFILEGCERQAVYFESQRHHRLHYGILKEEVLTDH